QLGKVNRLLNLCPQFLKPVHTNVSNPATFLVSLHTRFRTFSKQRRGAFYLIVVALNALKLKFSRAMIECLPCRITTVCYILASSIFIQDCVGHVPPYNRQVAVLQQLSYIVRHTGLVKTKIGSYL